MRTEDTAKLGTFFPPHIFKWNLGVIRIPGHEIKSICVSNPLILCSMRRCFPLICQNFRKENRPIEIPQIRLEFSMFWQISDRDEYQQKAWTEVGKMFLNFVHTAKLNILNYTYIVTKLNNRIERPCVRKTRKLGERSPGSNNMRLNYIIFSGEYQTICLFTTV